MIVSTFFRNQNLLRIESPSMDFRCVQQFQLLNVRDMMSPSQIPPAYNTYLGKIPGRTFLPNWWSLDRSFAEIG